VHEGVVTLAGHLHSYTRKLNARKAVQRVESVKAVVVELDVRACADWDATALHCPLNADGRKCQKLCVLRSVKKSQLMAQVKRSPNTMAN
jgi:hypothetical protein